MKPSERIRQLSEDALENLQRANPTWDRFRLDEDGAVRWDPWFQGLLLYLDEQHEIDQRRPLTVLGLMAPMPERKV